MKKTIVKQFQHFWRTFEKIVTDFKDAFWIDSGFALTTPARLAYHIIQSTKYYIGDKEPIFYKSGRSMEILSKDLQKQDLPSQNDIMFIINVMAGKTEQWLEQLDLEAKNIEYSWTGDIMGSVALFLIRHSQYHLGEMNALLNEQETGNAKDHFAKSL